VSPSWNVKPPKNDDEYFERMTKSIFTAGLNWSVVDKKWPSFQKAFVQFSTGKIAKFTERNVSALMNDAGIVRNERKIKATVHNAGEVLKLQKEHGSFAKYIGSFGTFRKNSSTWAFPLLELFSGLWDTSLRRTLKRRSGWPDTKKPRLARLLLVPRLSFLSPQPLSFLAERPLSGTFPSWRSSFRRERRFWIALLPSASL